MIVELIIGSLGALSSASAAAVATWNIAQKRFSAQNDQQKTVLKLAAHSLRSHLNNVLGKSQLLSSRAKSYRSEDQHLVESLLGSSGDVNRILLDVLELVEIDLKKLELDRNETLLWDVIRDIEGTALRSARKLGKTVQVEYADSLQAYYEVDGVRIHQCVTAMVGQCLSHTHTAEVALNATIERESGSGHRLAVSVHDSSTKLQQFQANAYFDPKAVGLERKLGGANTWRLSLLLAKKIANLAGGDLTVSANINDGLTFIYSLPIRYVRKAEKSETVLSDASIRHLRDHVPITQRSTHDPVSTKLLIIDDDATNLMILEALLNSIGYFSVVTANDGTEALELLTSGDFDAVLTDIQMPKMTGLELSKAIRCLPTAVSDVPILAVSAAATSHDRRLAEEAGINAFISKPILQDELAVVLKEQLDLSASHAVKAAS